MPAINYSPGMCKYTLCFLVYGSQVLMLLRAKEPNQGLLNGVGGHIETGETPYQACVREVFEETGYRVDRLHYGGLLTWESWNFSPGGLYLFTADVQHPFFVNSSEGTLAWCETGWVQKSDKVVANIHYFLPRLLSRKPAQHWHCLFDQEKLMSVKPVALPSWASESGVNTNVFYPVGGAIPPEKKV